MRVSVRSRSPVSRSRRLGGSGGRARAEGRRGGVGLDGEEQVVAAGEVPVLGRGAHDADATGERLVGLAGAAEGGVRVGADEDDGGAGGMRSVAAVGEAPAAEECVVGEELVAVVGGAGGEVELDEQVEGELQRVDAQLERQVGLDLA